MSLFERGSPLALEVVDEIALRILPFVCDVFRSGLRSMGFDGLHFLRSSLGKCVTRGVSKDGPFTPSTEAFNSSCTGPRSAFSPLAFWTAFRTRLSFLDITQSARREWRLCSAVLLGLPVFWNNHLARRSAWSPVLCSFEVFSVFTLLAGLVNARVLCALRCLRGPAV